MTTELGTISYSSNEGIDYLLRVRKGCTSEDSVNQSAIVTSYSRRWFWLVSRLKVDRTGTVQIATSGAPFTAFD